MSKKFFGLCMTVFALCVVAVAGPALAGPTAPAGKSNTGQLYLYEKNPADWTVVDGGAWGKMTYKLSGPAFDYVFNGHGLVPGGDYTLIYYPDKAGNPWPRTDVICLGQGLANNGGNAHIANAVDTTTSLPSAADINAGAKIWLVESAAVDCAAGVMSGWNPTEYLFEGDLINFTYEP
ncbi:MAG: hypothetical protein MUD10_04445 [Candidatus Pacebacteria bacterium]|jgi:hypothetical protein|nr:hypothetical protein [Candidatus Paceibacterota bacterium]